MRMQALLSGLSKVACSGVSMYGRKTGQMEVRYVIRLGPLPWHTLTETKSSTPVDAIQSHKFDMKASHRPRVSIRRPDHLG